MKRSELRNIIKEEIQNIIKEGIRANMKGTNNPPSIPNTKKPVSEDENERKDNALSLNHTNYAEELADFEGTLIEFRDIIDDLINRYGEDIIIKPDAGYSNVDFILSPPKS